MWNVFSKKFMVKKEGFLDNINLFFIIIVMLFFLFLFVIFFVEGVKFIFKVLIVVGLDVKVVVI